MEPAPDIRPDVQLVVFLQGQNILLTIPRNSIEQIELDFRSAKLHAGMLHFNSSTEKTRIFGPDVAGFMIREIPGEPPPDVFREASIEAMRQQTEYFKEARRQMRSGESWRGEP
jgi:hypothetical protein